MKSLLAPATTPTHKRTAIEIIILLLTSAVSIVIAAVLMPPGYSWQSNAISESAAQGVAGAWVARLGFLLFGFAVLWLAISLRPLWSRGAYGFHLAFGLFMVSTAAFSHRPWLAVPFDAFEDFLHSVTATAMGFAFSFGVLMRLLQRRQHETSGRTFDIVALIAAVALPLADGLWPAVGGLAQRLLFLIAYLWYANEALLIRDLTGRKSDQGPPGRTPPVA